MRRNRILPFFVGSVLTAGTVVSPTLQASGFQTSYHSVASYSRGLGGAGVAGDDLADFYYNPAGLNLYQPKQFQIYGAVGSFQNSYRDTGTTQPGAAGPVTGFDEGIDETIPGFSLQIVTAPVTSNGSVQFGIFLGNAFGNENTYSDGWIGRYHALESSLRAYDVSPTISFAIGDNTHMGISASLQRSRATLSQAVFTGVPDGKATFTGKGSGNGYAIGIVHEGDGMALGASFRSAVGHDLSGDLTIAGTPASNGVIPATVETRLPETVYLSAAFELDEQWNLYWTSRWTAWSRNEELRVVPALGPDSVTPQDWNDVWLHGIGFSYQENASAIKWRFGITVDETPIPDATLRTPRQPEGDRTWISFGASFMDDGGGVWDVGINHQIIDDADIANPKELVAGSGLIRTLNGSYSDGDFTMLGAQYRKSFN